MLEVCWTWFYEDICALTIKEKYHSLKPNKKEKNMIIIRNTCKILHLEHLFVYKSLLLVIGVFIVNDSRNYDIVEEGRENQKFRTVKYSVIFKEIGLRIHAVFK